MPEKKPKVVFTTQIPGNRQHCGRTVDAARRYCGHSPSFGMTDSASLTTHTQSTQMMSTRLALGSMSTCMSPQGRGQSSALWQLKEHCTAIRQRRDGRKIVPWYRCRDDRLPQKAANSSARWNYGGSRPNLSHVVAHEILATYAWHAHLTGFRLLAG